MSAYLRFRDELAGILDERFYTIEWLDCQVENGAIRCMGDDKAVILFEFKKYPTGWLELTGLAAAGELAGIMELITQAEELAKSMGCGSAEIASRLAWVRLLEDAGYKQYQCNIKKEF